MVFFYFLKIWKFLSSLFYNKADTPQVEFKTLFVDVI